jgi:hypothetical protein
MDKVPRPWGTLLEGKCNCELCTIVLFSYFPLWELHEFNRPWIGTPTLSFGKYELYSVLFVERLITR